MLDIVAFTGHRPNKLGGYDEKTNLRRKFLLFIDNYFKKNGKPKIIISGMALGVDTWAAQYAEARHIELHAYIPFVGQESFWPKESQNEYNRILLNVAKEIIVVEIGEYAAWKLQSRNKAMVNNCNLLIGIWDGSPGGTSNCLKYAEDKVKTIIFTPEEIWKFKFKEESNNE